MNPEALEYSYGLFKNDGYNGSLEEYQELIGTNQEALDYSFNLFTADGYDGSMEEFTNLTSGSEAAEEEVVEEEVEEEVVEEEEVIEEEEQMIDKAVGFDPTQEDRYSMDSQDWQYRDPYSRFVAKEMARIHNSGTPVKQVEEVVEEEEEEEVTEEEWLEEHGTSVYNFLMPDGSIESLEKWQLGKFMLDNPEAEFQDSKKVSSSPWMKKQRAESLVRHAEAREPTPNEIYDVNPFGRTNEQIESGGIRDFGSSKHGPGVYVPGEMEFQDIEDDDVIQTYKSGVQLINGPMPIFGQDQTSHGQDSNYEPEDKPWYAGAEAAWDHIAHAFADDPGLSLLTFGLTAKRYHYKLPNGQLVPYEYFNSPEAQDAYLKKQAQSDKVKGLVELGSEEKQVAYVEDKVSSFLTKSELIYKDKEAEFLELEKNAKTDDEKLAVSQLKSELDKERDKLGLGERLYDTEGKLLNSISAAREEAIDTKAEDLASTTGLDQLKTSLVDDYYEYMSLLKEVGNHTIDIGKSRSGPEHAIGYIRHAMEGYTGVTSGETFYDDVKDIQKMLETGELGSFVNLPGSHPLAEKFEDIQDRMLVKNRAIQLNSDASTNLEINEFARQMGNLMEAVTGENPIQKAYGMGLSVGKTDQEERFHIMQDIKNELGYVLPPELIANHEQTIMEYGGDVVTSLIPLVVTTLVLKKAGYTKPKVFNQLGDVLKGKGKSRVLNGVVNTLIGSTKYKHSALNEIAYFAGVDKAMELGWNSDPASNIFIGSLGSGNSIYAQASNKFLGKYGKIISPLLNAMNKSHVVAGAGRTLGPALSSTMVFEASKGVEHFVTHGIDGIEEIYSVKEVIGDFIGFAAMNVPGSMKPGIENVSRDILALRGYSIESYKAGKTLGLKPGKDGYFPTSKEINDKVLEKTNELIEAAGGEGAKIEAPELEQLQKEIYELEQAGEALNQHNDIVTAKKTASYTMGLDASAAVVAQKMAKGEELTATDQAILNQLGPEYIAYKLNGNKPAGVEMQGAVDRAYKNQQNTYKILDQMGINPMSKEGLELVTSMTEANKAAFDIEILKKQIAKQPGNKVLLEKQLEKANERYEQTQTEQKSIIEKSQEKSDKSYEEDVKDTESLIKEINEKGGFDGQEISLKEIDNIYDAQGKLVKSIDAQWKELGLDKDAEGQFRDNTLYIHKTRAQDRKANSVASHELLHALLKNSFKNRKGEITQEGMEIINNFRSMLSPDQQKLINDRISEQYAKDGKVPTQKYYEEYLTAFIDGIKQGKIQYSDKTWNKLAEQVGPNFRNLFGKGKVGVTSGKELYNFLRDFNKVGTSPKARGRIIEFATKDNVPGETGKEVEVKSEKPKARSKDSEVPVEKETFKIDREYDGKQVDHVVEVITNKDGSRTFTERDADGNVASSERVSKDNTLTNKEFVEGAYADVIGESVKIEGTEKINPKKVEKVKPKGKKAEPGKEENYSKEPITLTKRSKDGDPIKMDEKTSKNEDALLENMILRGIKSDQSVAEVFNIINKRIGFNAKEQAAVKRYIKSRVEGSVTTPFGKWRQGKPKTTPKKSVTSKSKELVKSEIELKEEKKKLIETEIELKEEKKKLIETQTKLGSAKSNTPEYKSNIKRIKEINAALKVPRKVKPVNSFKGLNTLDWKQYKNQKEWENSKEFVAAAEFIYRNPGIRAKIEKGLFGELATETNVDQVISKMIDHMRRFDPSIYKAPGSSSLLGYFNNQFSNRIGDVGNKAKKTQASSIDKALPGGEGKTTYAETLKSKDIEVGDEIKSAEPAPKSTMRHNKAIKFTPKEVKKVEKEVDDFIDTYADKIQKGDLKGKDLISAVRAKGRELIKKILIEKTPKPGRWAERPKKDKKGKTIKDENGKVILEDSAYKKYLEETYDEFKKLANFKVESGSKRMQGDPHVFIKPGGKGYKGIVYGEKGFSKSGGT